MNAAVLHSLGTTPKYDAFSDPVAAEGEAVIRVHAASLKSVDKQIAQGTHYASPRELPVVCGVDGVGVLENGNRVYFAGPRRPFGAMAEIAPVRRAQCFDLPDTIDDAVAAALLNPAVSAWLSLSHRAKLQRGETLLILGATGVTGRLAIQVGKILGAKRVVAVGRNEEILRTLPDFGADATVSLRSTGNELRESITAELRGSGIHVILDYLWGNPAEQVLAALSQSEFAEIQYETRFVQVGESAGTRIQLPAAILRSRAVTIMGTAGIPPWEILMDAMQQVLRLGAEGRLRMDIEPVPLRDVESAWNRELPGRRVVFIP